MSIVRATTAATRAIPRLVQEFPGTPTPELSELLLALHEAADDLEVVLEVRHRETARAHAAKPSRRRPARPQPMRARRLYEDAVDYPGGGDAA